MSIESPPRKCAHSAANDHPVTPEDAAFRALLDGKDRSRAALEKAIANDVSHWLARLTDNTPGLGSILDTVSKDTEDTALSSTYLICILKHIFSHINGCYLHFFSGS